jgi:hypothetical protein
MRPFGGPFGYNGGMDFMDTRIPIRDPEMMARMQVTFDLYEAAEETMRHRIRREHPELNEAEVEDRLVEWLMSRPKALYEKYSILDETT